jgi:hypothetical protein
MSEEKRAAPAIDRRDRFEVRKRTTSMTAPDLIIRILDEPERGARWRPKVVVHTTGVRRRKWSRGGAI